MDIVGIDISKARFDAALLIGGRVRHAAFSNTEVGFEELPGEVRRKVLETYRKVWGLSD